MKKCVLRQDIPKEVEKELRVYPDFMRQLLFFRGINTVEQAEKFLNPNYELDTHDPFLMKDMDKAVSRIILAIKNKEKIIIWSDYDADGIPGGVILHDFFKKIKYDNFENYIPHRHDEGFGLNGEAIKEFGESGVKLLITIDCGIANVKEVDLANSIGIDVIITDHHLPGEKLPKAFAIIDSKQSGDEYPYKNLCGSGVIFKLIQALIVKGNFDLKKGEEKWFLDMVGLATLSDMVSLDGENRVFAFYGLKVLRKTRRAGLVELFKKLKIDQKNLTEDDIGFSISPRVNAASRMGLPMDAFRMLSAEDTSSAKVFVNRLDSINNERKGVVASMSKEARKKLSSRETQEGMDKVIVLGNPEWRPSLLGLVANSLVEDFDRPVFLWGRDGEGMIKGSCRSCGKVSVVEIMSIAKESFVEFGGHDMSGGFSVSHEKIHLLELALAKACEKANSSISGGKFEINIDKKLSLEDINWETYKILEKLAPFGIGNPKPIFIFEKVKPVEVKIFGKEKNHLEILFKDSSNKKISAIAFFNDPDSFSKKIKAGDEIDLVATLEKSTFRNFPELRLRIVDIF